MPSHVASYGGAHGTVGHNNLGRLGLLELGLEILGRRPPQLFSGADCAGRLEQEAALLWIEADQLDADRITHLYVAVVVKVEGVDIRRVRQSEIDIDTAGQMNPLDYPIEHSPDERLLRAADASLCCGVPP
jgi:hypothetical protein